VLPRDVKQRVVALLLVVVQHRVHFRGPVFPFRLRRRVVLEQFLQRLGIHLERRVLVYVPLDHPDHVRHDLLRLLPVLLVPFLQPRHIPRRPDLNVQLHILGQTRHGEVARPHQRHRSDDGHARMGDVRLRVKFPLRIHPALDLPGLHGFHNRPRTAKEVVALFLPLQAAIQLLAHVPAQTLKDRLPRPRRRLAAHENANPVQFLPLPIQRQQRANLEKPGRNVERAGNLRPVLEVAQPLPVRVAVIYDEQLSAS